jgi:cyclopropane fatty-acyl-phospholipid synthase-like methyltransferase
MVSHRSTGLRKIFDWNFFYKSFQYIVGDYKLYRHILSLLPPLENKTILDVGCGNGRLLDFLPESVNYTGYDFNPRYIQSARRKYMNRKADFFVADINQAENPVIADIIFAIGILHHLTDESCSKFFQSALHSLNPSGIMMTVDPVLLKKQDPIARYIIKSDRGKCTRSPEGYLALSKNIFSSSEQFILNNVTNIPYNHIVIINEK